MAKFCTNCGSELNSGALSFVLQGNGGAERIWGRPFAAVGLL